MEQGAKPGDETTSAAESSAEVSATTAVKSMENQIAGEMSSLTDVLKGMPGIDASKAGGGDVSATTIGRMLGLATMSDLKLFDSKLDLLSSRITNVTTKLEKVLAVIQRVPTGSDLERIDVQIGALRSLIRETMVGMAGEASAAKASGGDAGAAKKPASSGVKIMTNTAPNGAEGSKQ